MSAGVPDSGTNLTNDHPDGSAAAAVGRAWLAALPAELIAQRRIMTGLLDYCEATPAATALLVGCSLGRGAADALSDVDAALGVHADPGEAGAAQVQAVAAGVVAALPGLGSVVDVLRHRYGPADRFILRIFGQFADRSQLDLTVMADAEIRRGSSAAHPDFVRLYDTADQPDKPIPADAREAAEPDPAYAVTGEQVREWAFLGWCALIDVDKYLRRGSLWEAHTRLHQARERIWALWAAAVGALYPWHGLSQVLDHDPRNLPPGIDATVAGLDATGLRRAAGASSGVLTEVSAAAARRCPAELPAAMADYVTRVLSAP
ncbi:MAG TPA: hypothetical protein VEH05_17315 [Streptosporangiaceae bacterium]|nr:hypothetical protein [Streptosporangiaceae bacterium]